MATTEITELQAATVFADGDLALIRKSGENKDRKISQSNLIKSIGNPAVKGFIASSDEANKVTLDPSNGTVIDTYYDGMEISFISPINSTGLVQVRIGALAYKDIFVLNSAASVELTTTTYIQAIYSATDNKFYQTNAATTQVFTNEYLATGVVAGDNSTTTYTLTSAYGIQKTEYYPRMSLSFNADIASKGGVLVNVDGLGNKTLTDKPGDKIANDLVEGQEIFAIYDGTNFIKNLFSETVPEAPELPADVFDEETGEIILDNVPEVNKEIVTVGNTGNDYTTISAAIAGLVANFGNDGGNRLCTINLSNTFEWSERVVLQGGKDYSWITIKSTGQINITTGGSILLQGGSAISLSGSYSKITNDNYSFIVSQTGSINLKDVTFVTNNSLLQINQGSVNFTNVTLGNLGNNINYNNFITCNNSNVTFKNITSTFSGNQNNLSNIYTFIRCKVIIDNFTHTDTLTGITSLFYINSDSEVTITNSNMTSTLGYFLGMLNISSSSIEMINTNMKSEATLCVNLTFLVNATFTNCNISAGVYGGFKAASGSDVTLDGGKYTLNGGNTTNSNDIISNNDKTIVRLKNNPLGGTSTNFGGTIVNQ